MRIFDPVHGLVVFEPDAPGALDGSACEPGDRHLQRAIDTFAFQRLRRIRQLGFADLVYPGATHTRFAHSVGVFHNARRMLARMRGQMDERDRLSKAALDEMLPEEKDDPFPRSYKEGRAAAARLAALLHDVGHGPFSHSFEGALRRLGAMLPIDVEGHERWSARVVREDGGLKRAVAEVGEAWGVDGLGDAVASMLEGGGARRGDIYSEVVSSQFDADRLDYLVRDRRSTGVDIGNFEADWLLDCLRVDRVGGRDRLVVASKGRLAVEAYLLARAQLHEAIYLHPTTRAFDKVFEDFVVALGIETRESGAPGFCSGSPLAGFLKTLVDGGAPTVADYLRIDDGVAWSLLAGARDSGHKALAPLARRLTDRMPYACIALDPGAAAAEDGSPGGKGAGGGASRELTEKHRRLASPGGIKAAAELLGVDPSMCDFVRLGAYRRGADAEGKDPEIYIRRVEWERMSRMIILEGSPRKCDPLASVSPLVRSLEGRCLFRIYFRSGDEMRDVESLLRMSSFGRGARGGGGRRIASAADLHDCLEREGMLPAGDGGAAPAGRGIPGGLVQRDSSGRVWRRTVGGGGAAPK